MNESQKVLSPEWWVIRLYGQLQERKRILDKFERYYKGHFDLPWLTAQAQAEFLRILKMTRTNYMGLVVDAMVERMNLVGFRRASNTEGSADEDIWRIWQFNRMDGFYDQGLLEGGINGMFYMLVAPNPKDEKNPFIWVEHPNQCIVEHVPGTNRRERAAGLKAWIDEWTGKVYATLYLPDFIYKFEAADPQAGIITNELPGTRQPSALQRQWTPRLVPGESWPARNVLGVVSLIESPNNPRLLLGGVSELHDVMDIQDRISKTVADRLITQDYGAFPQRMLSGWPREDASGNINEPVDVGRTRILTTDVAEARGSQFDAAPLDPYSLAKREDVKDIASRTRTPAHYLLGEMSNVNGEAMALDTSIPTPNGLVPIGSIVDGDEVYDERGTVQIVERAHDVLYDRPCYRITFDDGAEFVADGRHRWPVVSIPERQRSGSGISQRSHFSVMNTEYIKETLLAVNGQKVHAIDLALPPDGPEKDLPIDPYVLGAWLGDGSRGQGAICAGEQDVAEMTEVLESAGETVSVRQDDKGLYWMTIRGLRGRLSAFGILNDKHIPETYFQGSFKQRLALLQGLMDTDGAASSHENQGGSVAFDVHDERLANDTYRLICSLGHKVSLRRNAFSKNFDDKVISGTRYRMRWCPPDIAFRLSRKVALQNRPGMDRAKTLRRVIVSVEPVDSVPVRCLTVSGPSHLFLAGVAHVPTHNTLKASESGLVSKVHQRMSGHSDPAEDAARLLAKAAGINIPDDDKVEVMWDDPEFRTQAEKTDALVKMRAAFNLPTMVAYEKWGASPTEIERWMKLMDEEQQKAMALDPAMQLAEQYRKAIGGAGGPSDSLSGNSGGKPAPGKSPVDKQKVIKPNGLT